MASSLSNGMGGIETGGVASGNIEMRGIGASLTN
jgi:hypothetical protein